jgi:hypothetical protein
MTIKSVAKNVGSGLLTGIAIVADSQNNVRIAEIDNEIAKLEQEKSHLKAQLINR